MPAAPSGLAVTPTHDDGTRLSDVRVWDESLRPTGPPPASDSLYTPNQTAAAQHLVDVHDHLRAELDQVRGLMERVVAGTLDVGAARASINDMTMRQSNWTLATRCASYCRFVTIHHGLEDQAMFPQMRLADARLAPVIDRLAEEHVAIHNVLEDVDRALVAFVDGPDGATTDLRAAIDLLTDTLLSHLAYEERELVEPIARLSPQ